MSQQKIHCKDQCPDCHKDVKPEDQALACEMCAKWYHISCQGMGKTVYAFLMKKTCQIHCSVKYVMIKLSPALNLFRMYRRMCKI